MAVKTGDKNGLPSAGAERGWDRPHENLWGQAPRNQPSLRSLRLCVRKSVGTDHVKPLRDSATPREKIPNEFLEFSELLFRHEGNYAIIHTVVFSFRLVIAPCSIQENGWGRPHFVVER